MSLPTVKVCDDKDGFIIINKSDFDNKQHKLFEEKPAKKKKSKKVK